MLRAELFDAVEKGDAERLNDLIKQGVDLESKNDRNETPLHVACFFGQYELVKLLLDNGANINAEDEKDRTPLYSIAAVHNYPWLSRYKHKDHPAIVKLLVDVGADISPTGCILDDLLTILELNTSTRSLTVYVPIHSLLMNGQKQSRLAKVLQKCPTIVKLALDHTDLSHAGMYELSEVLKGNNTLRVLDLSSNYSIGSRAWPFRSGVQYLVSALYYNTGLLKLNLKNCYLDKADIRDIVKFFKSRKHKTLKKIDLDDDVIAKLSPEEKKILPNAEVDESKYLVPPKVKKTEQDISDFFEVINRIEPILPHDSKKYQSLKEQLQEELITTDQLSVEQKEILAIGELSLWIQTKKKEYISGESDQASKNVRYMNELAGQLEIYHQFLEAPIDWLKSIQGIVGPAQEAALAEWILIHDKKGSAVDTSTEARKKAFRKSFHERMDALFTAANNIKSGYGECAKKTPIEHVADCVKHAVLAVPFASAGAGGVLHLLHAAKSAAHVLEQFVTICHLIEAAENLAEIPSVEHRLQHFKDTIIRKIHGATIPDRLKNLLHCFEHLEGYGSKSKSLARAIEHSYGSLIASLTPAQAALCGEYVFLHLADLFMSGAIEEPLKEEELCEKAILWLSYVPLRHHLPKIKTTDGRAISLTDSFVQAGVQFKDNKGILTTHFPPLKDNKGELIEKDSSYPPRWATEREIVAITKQWYDPQSNTNQDLVIDAKKRELTFDKEAVSKLKIEDLPLGTEKKSHLSKSKRLKKHDKRLDDLDERFEKIEEQHEEQLKELEKRLEEKFKTQLEVKIKEYSGLRLFSESVAKNKTRSSPFEADQRSTLRRTHSSSL